MANTSDTAKPDNYQINAKICRLVERYPCMYDRTHPHYLKKDVVDKAWIKIAKEMDDSIPSCKERWRNIRTSFARSINVNKIPASANRTKPYYLHEELQFLARHITPGIPVSRRWNSSCYSAGEESEMVEVAVGEESFDGFAAMAQEDDESQQHQPKAELFNCNSTGGSADDDNSTSDVKHNVLRKSQDMNKAQQCDAAAQQACAVPLLTATSASNVSAASTVHAEQAATQQKTQQPAVQQAQETSRIVELMPPMSTPICSYPPKKRQRTLEMFNPCADEREKEQPEREIKPNFSSATDQHTQTDYDAIFLQGLLPEIKAMDFHQKITFKRRIYEVITEIFNSKTAPTPPQLQPTTNNTAHLTNGACAVIYNNSNLAQSVPLTVPMNVPASSALTNTNSNGPSLALVNASELNMLRRLNVLLQQTTDLNNVSSNAMGSPTISLGTPSNTACISSASSTSTSIAAGTTQVTALPKNVASISSTVRSTPTAATTNSPTTTNMVSVSRGGALTRSSSNLLRVRIVNTPASTSTPNVTDSTTSPQHQPVKQEPDVTDY